MDQDDSISDVGLAAPAAASGRVLVIACGALAREILALKALNRWEHLDLQCLPAKLHLWPDRIPDAVEAAVAEARPAAGALRVARGRLAVRREPDRGREQGNEDRYDDQEPGALEFDGPVRIERMTAACRAPDPRCDQHREHD